MKKQKFTVYIVVETEIESGGKPYLTETRVRKQIEKFVTHRNLADGLPCHGTSTIKVTECIEDHS